MAVVQEKIAAVLEELGSSPSTNRYYQNESHQKALKRLLAHVQEHNSDHWIETLLLQEIPPVFLDELLYYGQDGKAIGEYLADTTVGETFNLYAVTAFVAVGAEGADAPLTKRGTHLVLRLVSEHEAFTDFTKRLLTLWSSCGLTPCDTEQLLPLYKVVLDALAKNPHTETAVVEALRQRTVDAALWVYQDPAQSAKSVSYLTQTLRIAAGVAEADGAADVDTASLIDPAHVRDLVLAQPENVPYYAAQCAHLGHNQALRNGAYTHSSDPQTRSERELFHRHLDASFERFYSLSEQQQNLIIALLPTFEGDLAEAEHLVAQL